MIIYTYENLLLPILVHFFFCSIFVCSALGNILGKFGVPYLTFPFNLLAIVTFLSLQTIYPALPEENKNNVSYNCSLLETQFKVNKKMNEKCSINTQAFDVMPSFSSCFKLPNFCLVKHIYTLLSDTVILLL